MASKVASGTNKVFQNVSIRESSMDSWWGWKVTSLCVGPGGPSKKQYSLEESILMIQYLKTFKG